MSIQEKIAKVEADFNQLKEVYTEKEQEVQKLQTELVDIEKQLIFTRGAYQALAEMLNETADVEVAEVAEIEQ